MVKRISLSMTIIVLVVILSGCLHFQVDLELNKDNTGKITSTSAVDMDMADAFGDENSSQGSTSTVIENLPLGLKGVEVERTDLDYKSGDSTYKGEKVVISFNNTDEFFKEMAKSNEQELRIIDLPNGNKRVEINPIQDNSAEDFNIYEIISELGGKMGFTLKTDYNVVNHNASSVNNGVYTWNLLELIIASNQPEFTIFLEYTPEGKNPVAPILGKTRVEVEKSLGINLISKDFHGNALNKLGILKGTEKGLELEKGLTRAEGATMYARLLGVESEIEKWAKENPNYNSGFKDLPNWAKQTVNYLHAKNLVKGVSSTEYGSNSMMSVNDFTTLVLRALGYNDSSGDFQWNNAGTKTQEIGLYSDDKIQPNNVLEEDFTRGSMSYVSYNALFFKNPKTGERLIDNLTQ